MKPILKLNTIKMMKRLDFVILRCIYLNMSNATKVQYIMHKTSPLEVYYKARANNEI